MTMIDRRLRSLWENLQLKKRHMPNFLAEVGISGIRGIENLHVAFDYPVSVVAGGNASGKTTVLFAAACAYKDPAAKGREYFPSTLFPDYRPQIGDRADEKLEVMLEFQYATTSGSRYMRWRRAKGWNRSFGGRKDGGQPERPIYLRTLSNLSNPSEVRGVLSMSRLVTAPEERPLNASQIEFAQQMLPFRYREVVDLSSGKKNLLFATQQRGAVYSELHMASGERAILRLSQEIAQLSGALILVDEVEAGLHPSVQQMLMLQLQQLALRNDLQVIVTTHSPVILESVPSHGRVFLDRLDDGTVTVMPPYRDIVQNALYGRSRDALNILCEDDIAEGIVNGVFDVLRPEVGVRGESVRVGRDTGADEFPTHARAFRKFDQLVNFVFVLDGDKQGSQAERRLRETAGDNAPVLFLPGTQAPEVWIWNTIMNFPNQAAEELGTHEQDLLARMNITNSIFDSASDSPGEIAKAKLESLANEFSREPSELCRRLSRIEAQRPDSDIQVLLEGLKSALLAWRAE